LSVLNYAPPSNQGITTAYKYVELMQCANSLTCKSQGKQRVAARATVRSRIPLGREGTPADVAGAVIYLTSELGAYLTGETIIINGGQSMY
jgi:NAD(P)-dependent dehydrogenase (short-subunit alcohol dehydrogenase family)